MEATPAFRHLELRFVDQIQWRYALIRPLVLFEERPARQRAEETQTHPETVRKLRRRFQHQGLLGLLRDDGAGLPKGKAPRVPAAVVEALARRTALSPGFHYRELARMLVCTTGYRMDHKTVKRLWQASPLAAQGMLPLGPCPSPHDRYQVRVQALQLSAQGGTKRRLSQLLRVSRPSVTAWSHRFAAEHFAGLLDQQRGPKAPRQVWLPGMVEVYHLQKRHPEAGEFRIWRLLGRTAISIRTGGRVMALNRQVYADIPHGRHTGPKPPPQPHP